MDRGVGVPVKERGERVARVPTHEIGEMAMGIVFEIVAEFVGDFPFFDLAPGADMEAFIQCIKSRGDVGCER